MMKHLLWLIFAALLAASSPASAGSLTIGVSVTGTQVVITSASPTDAQCQPFGCPEAILTGSGQPSPLSWTPEFQQVYSSLALPPGSTTFTGIAFYCYGGQPNSGTFKISLSTTSALTSPSNTYPFDTGLNTSNLSTNVGSDNTVVYTGTLPSLSNGMLTITFTTPFTYNTANGNLLLDVQPFTTATNSNPFIYCYNSGVRSPNTPWILVSSMAWTNSNIGYPPYIMGRGLITTFSY